MFLCFVCVCLYLFVCVSVCDTLPYDKNNRLGCKTRGRDPSESWTMDTLTAINLSDPNYQPSLLVPSVPFILYFLLSFTLCSRCHNSFLFRLLFSLFQELFIANPSFSRLSSYFHFYVWVSRYLFFSLYSSTMFIL